MDSENVFELFFQAVNNGDTVQLDEILNYFGSANTTKLLSLIGTWDRRPAHGKSLKPWVILNVLLLQMKFGVDEQWKFSTQHLPLSLAFSADENKFFRDVCHEIPITEFIKNLASIDDDDPLWLELILEAIVTSSITRTDKIIALELMGAAFILMGCRILHISSRTEHDDRSNLVDTGLLKGIQCWKDAWILRNATADGEPAIPNIPHVVPEPLLTACNGIDKQLTLEELEKTEQRLLLHQIVDYWWDECRGPLQIQALIISRKLVRESNHGQTFLILFYYDQLLNYAFDYSYHGRVDRIYYILLFIVGTFYDNIAQVTFSMPHLRFLSDSINHLHVIVLCNRKFTSAHLLVVAKCILKIVANMHSDPVPDIDHLKCLSYQIRLKTCWHLLHIFPKLNQRDYNKLKNYFLNYIEIFQLHCGLTTFLHLIFIGKSHDFCLQTEFSEVRTVFQFFLDAGVDPNETDKNGEAAIHILAKNSATKEVPIMLKALLSAGAHVDQATPNGETVYSILNQQQLEFHFPSFHPFDSVADDPLNVVLPLSCYCAQSIRRNRIPVEDKFPPNLQRFVSAH